MTIAVGDAAAFLLFLWQRQLQLYVASAQMIFRTISTLLVLYYSPFSCLDNVIYLLRKFCSQRCLHKPSPDGGPLSYIGINLEPNGQVSQSGLKIFQ